MQTARIVRKAEQQRAVRPTEERPIAIAKILVPIDFSPASERSLKYAERLAEQLSSQLILLHVIESAGGSAFAAMPMASEKEMLGAEKNLCELTKGTQQGGAAAIKWSLRTGVAAHEIVTAAKELDADLIVIASHGLTGWKHFAIGSTADRVARAAPCPVLVVREKEHDFV